MSDSWISWKPRIEDPSKPEAVLEDVLGELRDGHGEVLGEARQVAEPQVDDLDVVFLREREDVLRCLRR